MTEILASFLGAARVTLEGRTVELSTDTAVLLACVLTEPEETRGAVIASTCPDGAEAAANALNAALGCEIVCIIEGVARLAADVSVRTDLERLQDEDPEEVSYDTSLFLEGAEGPWITAQREKYRGAHAKQLRLDLAARWLAHRYGACEKACACLLKLEPLDETAHYHLMKIYELEGEYGKATELFRHYEAALAENGCPPAGQEIRKLAESLPQESRANEILDFMSMRSAVDCN